MNDIPSHISNENGVSCLSGKGYGAIVTRDFFETIDRATVESASVILSTLGNTTCLLVVAAIVSMSDISIYELQERLAVSDTELRKVLDALVESNLVEEKFSKHKALGTTYRIAEQYHTCLCIILSTLCMQEMSLKDMYCCMGYGDYPIKL